jgi:PAS domain S-box-containing protein
MTTVEHPDLAIALKVVRALSGETELEKLIATVLRLSLEHAGADRGLLLLRSGNEYRIEAEARLGSDGPRVELRQASVTSADLPTSLFSNVLQTGESVLLEKASGAPTSPDDDYVRRNRICSVVFLPLLTRSQLVGVIYLENTLARGALAAARMVLLELLTTEAAISLEHAHLCRALRERERQSRLDVDSIPALAWSARPDGSAEFFNQHYLDFIGFSAEQASGFGWTAAVHPEDVNALAATWQHIMASEAPGEAEARLRRHDGSYRWFLFRSNPLRNETGAIVKWYGVNTDIDDRKKVEEALRSSERNLSLMINAIPTFIQVSRPDGTVLSMNQTVLDYHGVSLQDVQKEEFRSRFYHPEDAERLREIRNEALKRPLPFEYEQRALGKDGRYRWFMVRYNPLLDEQGRIERWYAAAFDIEDRKQAEAELRRAYDSFADAQGLSKTGGFITDLVGDDHNWSEETFRIFGFEPRSKVTLERIQRLIHSDDRPSFESMIARAMSGSNVTFSFRILTEDTAAVKHLRGTAHVVEKIEGRPMFVGAIQDVTESKVAEEALDRARSELARVARVTAVSAFTASIAHEVNQPLSGIITNAGTCLRMLAADPPDVNGARETARRTLRDGNRASDVITRLRALFSKREFTLEPLDINEIAQEVVALSLSELQRNRMVLRSEFGADLPPVTGDRIQLQQVILNLLRNASDAMLGVHDRPRQLLIATELEADSRVRLTVRDVGVGLDAQSMDKLFDAFYTTKTDGMGIGLSVSRSIIERHQGHLWAEPNDGPGTTFAFALPAAAERVAMRTNTNV